MAGQVNTEVGCLGRLWTFYRWKPLRLDTNLLQEYFSPFLAQDHSSVLLPSDIAPQTIFPLVFFNKYVKQ